MRDINKTWAAKPGNWDPLKATELQPSDNGWGIPSIKPELESPDWLAPYDDWRTAKNKGKPLTKQGTSGVHFFIDDYRFEAAWNNPARTSAQLAGVGFVLSPDFSCYRDHPLALQIWQIYRSRWLGAFWQSLGLRVIPTVCWSEPSSYDFCFLGLPTCSVVAVSTVGVNHDPEALALFRRGYTEMVKRVTPSLVLVYGEKFETELMKLAPWREYRPWQLGLRAIDAKKQLAKLPKPEVARQRKLPSDVPVSDPD